MNPAGYGKTEGAAALESKKQTGCWMQMKNREEWMGNLQSEVRFLCLGKGKTCGENDA